MEKDAFGFLDIGSGGGFDSLEISRLLSKLPEKDSIFTRISIVNVDIDTFWLQQNENLSNLLYEGKPSIVRRNMSIFDYINRQLYLDDFMDRPNLLISCNGFAEFFEDEPLGQLFKAIARMTKDFKGHVYLILPFAVKNYVQESMARVVGFNYRARDIATITRMIQENFPDFTLETNSQFSQLILMLHRKAA